MNVVNAILIKLVSVLLFAMMSVLVRWLGDRVPLGQMVFFRSAFAILPVLLFYAWRGELMAAVRTDRPCRPRPDQRRQHVPEFRRAGPAAACRRQCVVLRGAADHS